MLNEKPFLKSKLFLNQVISLSIVVVVFWMQAVTTSCNKVLRSASTIKVSGLQEDAAIPTFDEFAQSVALLERRVGGVSSRCTGTLVNKRTILTAAHCLVDGQGRLIQPKSIRARFRSSATEPWVDYGVDSLHTAPKFKPGQSWSTGSLKNFDFGGIVLDKEVEPKFTQHLPTVVLSSSQLHEWGVPGGKFYFAGYGGIDFGETQHLHFGSGVARSIEDCIIPIQQQLEQRGENLNSAKIAAKISTGGQVGIFCLLSGKGGYYTEQGDSGGPAFVRRSGRTYLLGVTRAGNGSHSWALQKISTFESLDDKSTVAWFRRVLGQPSQPCSVQ